MQQHYYKEKLNQMEEQMRRVGKESGRAFNDLKQALPPKRTISEPLIIEQQTGVKDNSIGLSKKRFSEKDVLLDNMRNEMDILRSSEDNAMILLSDYKRRIQELETELDKRKESEANLFDTLVMQTKQLEHNKILLEESKLEMTSLKEKIKELQKNAMQTTKTPDGFSKKEKVGSMENEAELSGEGMTMAEELNMLRNELKLATEAEENSKTAMDDLVFALKEVATEANQVKAKLTLSEVELEHTKGDAERWRTMFERTEDKYKESLETTKKDAERYKNTAERLRLEAEESLLAWNQQETEFVNCIRRADEERSYAQQESTRVLDLLNEAENKIMVSKEENQKLRDILKQALNESNVAKEAAEIAKAENARLQDSLDLLVHENEMLKIHEAASFENIKELKRMLSESSSKEVKHEEMEKPPPCAREVSKGDNNNSNRESWRKPKAHNNTYGNHKEFRESKSLNKAFSFNIKEMIAPNNHKQQHNKVESNDANNKEIDDDTLKGSIFDDVNSSGSESRSDAEMEIPDDFDHLDESHFDDPDSDRNSRKRRALLRRFGDLIRRRSYHNHRSNEEHLQT